jgi:hypothetical protein
MLTVRDPQRKGVAKDSTGEAKRAATVIALRFIGMHRKAFFCYHIGYSFYAMTLFCLMSWTPAF